jgi:poly(3-hydroxybutyrate) depolymerase
VGDSSISSTGCGLTGKPTGDLHRTTKDGNGTTRDYEVLVPASYDGKTPLALTFAFHGAGGDEAASKSYGLQDAPGARDASIFVFPQGIPFQSFGVGWADACGSYDMVFFDHMLSELEADYCIDPTRVFAAGFSWGCDFATALACCRGARLRAIGANACTDEFGKADDATTYDNLPCPSPGRPAIRFSHDASGGDSGYPAPLFTTTSALYRTWNGCAATSKPVSPSPCVAYDGCSSPLVECPIPNLGHSVPGGWGTDTWSFFAQQ